MKRAWKIAGALAVVALISLGIREFRHHRLTRAEDTARQDATIARLMEMLTKDPRARLEETRVAVHDAAALVDEGVRQAEPYYAEGLLLHSQEQYSKAVVSYERAIFLKPTWSWPHIGRGISLHMLERNDEAFQAFQNAIRLAPTDPRPHDDLAILFRRLGRFEEAEKEAQIALQLGPNEISSHNNFGNLLLALGKYAEAEEAYRKAIAMDPTHPTPYYNLACVSAKQGKAAEAVEYLKQAFELDPAFHAEAKYDPDFELIKEDPAFKALFGD